MIKCEPDKSKIFVISMAGYSIAGLIALGSIEFLAGYSVNAGEYAGCMLFALLLSLFQCSLAKHYLIQVYEDRLVSSNVKVSGPARCETILADEVVSLSRSRILNDLIVHTKSGDSIRFPSLAYKNTDFEIIVKSVSNMYNNSHHSPT